MLELYQGYQRKCYGYRLLCYSIIGITLLLLVLSVSYTAHRQQQVQQQAHWQHALLTAQQAHRLKKISFTPRNQIHAQLTLRQRLQLLFAQFPKTIGVTQLQLEPTRVMLRGVAADTPALLTFCQQLVARYPHTTRHHLSQPAVPLFQLELRTPTPLPTTTTWQSTQIAARYYAWLTQTTLQRHLQVISSRLSAPHHLQLRVFASYAGVLLLLQQLEILLSPQACVSLTLKADTNAARLMVTVLCQ